MRQPLAFFGILLFMIIGFTLLFTNYRQPTNRMSQLMSEKRIDDCYEESMNTWFVEFNANQNSGIAMGDADKVASAKAVEDYEICLNQ